MKTYPLKKFVLSILSQRKAAMKQGYFKGNEVKMRDSYDFIKNHLEMNEYGNPENLASFCERHFDKLIFLMTSQSLVKKVHRLNYLIDNPMLKKVILLGGINITKEEYEQAGEILAAENSNLVLVHPYTLFEGSDLSNDVQTVSEMLVKELDGADHIYLFQGWDESTTYRNVVAQATRKQIRLKDAESLKSKVKN